MIKHNYSFWKHNLVMIDWLKMIRNRVSEGSIRSVTESSDPRSDVRPGSK